MTKSTIQKNFILKVVLPAVLTVLVVSCVSLKIKGSNPVQRAQSAAHLLVEGNTTDAYIKQYNKEMDKALSDIDSKLIRIETNPEAYEDVADAIQDWIKLYDEIYILERNYPAGLTGKKQTAFFTYIDYRPLQQKAALLACESQFQKAKELSARSYSYKEKIPVLDHLKKAKSYSSHLDAQINEMGASINYEEAQRLFGSGSSQDLKESMRLFSEASQWIPDYKGSNSLSLEAKVKASNALLAEGDAEMKKMQYTAFRKAYALYTESKEFGNVTAQKSIEECSNVLTVKLGIVYSGKDSYYPDENGVKLLLSNGIGKNVRGPMFVETDFIYLPSSSSMFELFLNTFTAVLNALTSGNSGFSVQKYDIIAYPGENFNKVMEKIGTPVRETELVEKFFCETRTIEPGKADQITVKEVSAFEFKNPRPSETDGTRETKNTYWTETGKIIKDIQTVELWKDYSYELYDVRNNRRIFLTKLNRITEKKVYTFIKSIYSGSESARPKTLVMDDFYSAGKYREFGLTVNEEANPYQIISASSFSYDGTGNQLCREIGQLEYIP